MLLPGPIAVRLGLGTPTAARPPLLGRPRLIHRPQPVLRAPHRPVRQETAQLIRSLPRPQASRKGKGDITDFQVPETSGVRRYSSLLRFLPSSSRSTWKPPNRAVGALLQVAVGLSHLHTLPFLLFESSLFSREPPAQNEANAGAFSGGVQQSARGHEPAESCSLTAENCSTKRSSRHASPGKEDKSMT
jgi:hypothetical protein